MTVGLTTTTSGATSGLFKNNSGKASNVVATTFNDDLTIVPQKATVRVYDLAGTLGTLSLSTGGNLTAPGASPYVAETPGAVTLTLTSSTSAHLVDSLNVEVNQVYSVFVFDGQSTTTNSVTAGEPEGLPQTGYHPGPNPWLVVILLLAIGLVVGGGVFLWRRQRLAR